MNELKIRNDKNALDAKSETSSCLRMSFNVILESIIFYTSVEQCLILEPGRIFHLLIILIIYILKETVMSFP